MLTDLWKHVLHDKLLSSGRIVCTPSSSKSWLAWNSDKHIKKSVFSGHFFLFSFVEKENMINPIFFFFKMLAPFEPWQILYLFYFLNYSSLFFSTFFYVVISSLSSYLCLVFQRKCLLLLWERVNSEMYTYSSCNQIVLENLSSWGMKTTRNALSYLIREELIICALLNTVNAIRH